MTAKNLPTEWMTGLDHWQTLASGVLAILAALIGAGFVYHQTRVSRALDRDRLNRRHAAARSTLPLVLSGMMEYARVVGAGLRKLHLSSANDVIGRDAVLAWEPPPLPADGTRALSEVIEAASNEMADVISDLLSQLQVQSVRLRGVKADAVSGTPGRRNMPKTDLEVYICDIADIYARCEALLGYARRETETAKADPSAEALQRALFLMDFHEAAFDHLKETVARRAERAAARKAQRRGLLARIVDRIKQL
jgi:hypothetical protein